MEYDVFRRSYEDLISSLEFKELKVALAFPEPNLWEILGISRKENMVSRFLAWLLEPQARHSFSDSFLKGLLAQALATEEGKRSDLTLAEMDVITLSDVEVKVDRVLVQRRPDILIYSAGQKSHQDSGFLCILENKIDAKEAEDQTNDYYVASFEKFPQDDYPNRVYIYLSPDGDRPHSEKFIPLSYRAVLRLVQDLQGLRQTTETERFLLSQFEENLLRGIAMDSRTADLAQAAYDKHRDVLEFIMQNVDRDEVRQTENVWDGRSRFFNIGEKAGPGYRWDDCRAYGFICAGGARLYRGWMEQLDVGDIIYAYVSEYGYVGVGTVTQKAVTIRQARLPNGRPFSDVGLNGEYNYGEDDDTCDWVALVEWERSVEKDQAVRLSPITRATTSRIYDHRKDIVEQIETELAQ